MNYLDPTEYVTYGLDAATDQSWITAASAVMDAHCRRASLGVVQYEERMKLATEMNTVRLSYLPLVAVSPATSPIVSLQGRYGNPRRGEWPLPDLSLEVATAFSLPGAWAAIDATSVDIDLNSGEMTFPANVLGLFFNEVDIVYNAGLAPIPPGVKVACAQIVKNAQAMPALNVKTNKMDKLRMDYFGGSLVDETVRSLLAGYVAGRS